MNTFRLVAHYGFWSVWSSTPENPCRNSAVAVCEAGRRPGYFCRKGYRYAGPRCAVQMKRRAPPPGAACVAAASVGTTRGRTAQCAAVRRGR